MIRSLGNDINKREPVESGRDGLLLRNRLREVSNLVFKVADALAKRRVFAGAQRPPFPGRLAYEISGLRSCLSQHGRSRVGNLARGFHDITYANDCWTGR
jgi:hypothetical protein